MCGFPLSHLDRHLKVLVDQERRFVALCEEFRMFDGSFDRRVVRVVTPGTLIDESFLNHYENNYLLALYSSPDGRTDVGLAWIDVSTGDFFSQSTTVETIRDDLARIGPREVVLHGSIKDQSQHPFRIALGEDPGVSITYLELPPHLLPSIPNPDSADSADDAQDIQSPPNYTTQETSAIQLLATFLRGHLLELMPQLPSPTRKGAEIRMQIDSHTIDALEIKQGMREGGVVGSLMSTIKRTVTSSGTRLLSRWLCVYFMFYIATRRKF